RALLSLYLVNSPGDAGKGTGLVGDLRYAIDQANHASGDSTILFVPSLNRKTVVLTAGMLSINKPSGTLTIRGPGADALALSGGGHGQVFAISPTSNVTISGMTITGGVGPEGGGILNDGKLTISNCTIAGNTSFGGGGGGLANDLYGTLTLVGSTV